MRQIWWIKIIGVYLFQAKGKNMTSVKLNNITFDIKAETELTGKAKGFYTSLLLLKRPKGNKEFWATRDVNGIITLN